MNRIIIALLAFSLSIVAAGCASKMHKNYSPHDEHDDAVFDVTDAEIGERSVGTDVAADPRVARPAGEAAAAAETPVVDQDPIYRAELRRRELQKRRRAAERKALLELTGGK
jgi:hypothetical protein